MNIFELTEGWSQKYKNSIDCSHPKGFSQRAHCAGKKKHNESIEMEMVCEDCGMCETHGNLNEIKKGQKDSNGYTKCWPGYRAQGTKKSNTTGKQVRNCVPVKEDESSEYDETAMATNSLHTLKRAVDGLHKVVESGVKLPEWCEEKISMSKQNLVSVWDYLLSQQEPGDQLQESKIDVQLARDIVSGDVSLASVLNGHHRVSPEDLRELRDIVSAFRNANEDWDTIEYKVHTFLKAHNLYECTTSGAVASVAMPLGGVRTRDQGVYGKKRSGRKFMNSAGKK